MFHHFSDLFSNWMGEKSDVIWERQVDGMDRLLLFRIFQHFSDLISMGKES